ncbi:MAG TPA: sulfur carrier protein ThiS [Gaiellaceae bacterium]|nr:sulfur carrier protein ThiS [Gaiellaceae bacterium]
MTVLVNGEPRLLEPGTTVEALVRTLVEEPERGVAVALDREVLPRRAWGETTLRDGQEIEVLQAVAGG